MLTSEELRVAALDASAKRGKTVARRRVVRRWAIWVSWRIILPTIGLATVLAATFAFAAYAYYGFDTFYGKVQTWAQINVDSKLEGKVHKYQPINNTMNNANNYDNAESGMQLTPSTTMDYKTTLPTQPEGQKP